MLWAAYMPERLGKAAMNWLGDEDHDLHYSPASIWEVTIKSGLGREDFRVDPTLLLPGLVRNGWKSLPILAVHALEVINLPLHHSDQFDRILIAQAKHEGWPLLTSDRTLSRYGSTVELV